MFHRGFKHSKTIKALGLRPRAFISFLVLETPMKHSHSFLKYYLKNIYLKNNLHNVQKLYKKSKNVQKKKKIYIQLFKISAPHSVNSNLTLTVKLANFFAQNPRRKAHTFFCLHYSPKTIGCLGNHTCC